MSKKLNPLAQRNEVSELLIAVCWSSARTSIDGGRKTHWLNAAETGPRCGVRQHLLYDSGDERAVTAANVHMHIDCERCLGMVANYFGVAR